MFRRMAIMLMLVGVAFAAIFGFQAFKARMIQKAISSLRNPPQTVSTITAATQSWQKRLEAVGSTKAEKGAELSAQVPGIVKAIHFQSGAKVEKGTLLVELEAADDIAHLQALKATEALAQLNYDRDSRLLKTDAISQETADTDLATLKSNQAQVAQQDALVGYKSITAPFSGRLGIRQVDLGQYIAPGTPIVTLQQLDPIFVDFYLPQQALARDQGRTVGYNQSRHLSRSEIRRKNSGDQPAGQHGEPERPGPGDIRQSPTRSCCQGCLPQSTFKSAYRSTTSRCRRPRSTTIPMVTSPTWSKPRAERTMGRSSMSQSRCLSKTGETRGDQVAVLSGIEPGDVVTTAGQNKLHNGSPVRINNDVKVPFSANPRVSEE